MSRDPEWWTKYHEYLEGPVWAEVRAQIMYRAKGMCEREGCVNRAVQVHHKTYRNLGHELPEDLLALCLPCHQAEHPGHKIGDGPKFYSTQPKPKKKTSKSARTRKTAAEKAAINAARRAASKARKKAKTEHRRGRYQCPACSKRCREEKFLEEHIRVMHKGVALNQKYILLPPIPDVPPPKPPPIEKPLGYGKKKKDPKKKGETFEQIVARQKKARAGKKTI